MPVKRYPVIDESIVQSISEVLGRTEGGLTTKQIIELLAAAGVPDPTPAAPPGHYVVISKRDRLFNALAARQRRDACGNAVPRFVGKALAPVRFHDSPSAFEALRAEVNVPLAFAGYYVDDAGTLRPERQAKPLSEARRRAMRLRTQLVERGAHARLLRYCVAGIDDDNCFHAVFEASKSLADEIRRRTGCAEDGVPLIDVVFERGQRDHPLLALNIVVCREPASSAVVDPRGADAGERRLHRSGAATNVVIDELLSTDPTAPASCATRISWALRDRCGVGGPPPAC